MSPDQQNVDFAQCLLALIGFPKSTCAVRMSCGSVVVAQASGVVLRIFAHLRRPKYAILSIFANSILGIASAVPPSLCPHAIFLRMERPAFLFFVYPFPLRGPERSELALSVVEGRLRGEVLRLSYP
jgi:hypothetical protein